MSTTFLTYEAIGKLTEAVEAQTRAIKKQTSLLEQMVVLTTINSSLGKTEDEIKKMSEMADVISTHLNTNLNG